MSGLMGAAMALIDLKLCTIKLKDGGSNYIEIGVDAGSLEYVEKRNVEFVKRRGLLDTVREGDEEPIDVSFQFAWSDLTAHGGDPPTIEDVLKNKEGWASTSPDPNAPYCIDIEITKNCGSQEVILLEEFHYAELSHSTADATVDCRGQCNRVFAGIS